MAADLLPDISRKAQEDKGSQGGDADLLRAISEGIYQPGDLDTVERIAWSLLSLLFSLIALHTVFSPRIILRLAILTA